MRAVSRALTFASPALTGRAPQACAALFAVAALAAAQPQLQFPGVDSSPKAPTVLSAAQDAAQKAQEAERAELIKALNEAATSPLDMVRVLEAHLAKYPNSAQRREIETAIARASIDLKDDARIARYGQLALQSAPDDVLLLDRVSGALLNLGGKENAQKAIRYAGTLHDLIEGMEPPTGKDIVQRQEERDRARGRMLIYQSRAHMILGEPEEAARLASLAFTVYPNEESARYWGEALIAGNQTEEGVRHLAEAFAIPDSHTTESQRQDDRLRVGQLYAKLHGSETGLGDLILDAYDRTSTLVETRQKRVAALDPNSSAANAMDYTVTGLDGHKLKLSSLKGKVVVLDFWATWCAPCRIQHPLYEQVKTRFKEREDLVFLAIDTDDDRSVVEPFLADQNWDKNVYYEDGLSRLLQVSSIPTTVIFDKKGKVASRMNGFVADSFVEQLSARLIELLNAE
jgi:thiol-disulfide isomerase/thioredoxin